MISALVDFIREQYRSHETIPLHAPVFDEKEKEKVAETIDSTFVSSVGIFVDDFERMLSEFVGDRKVVATVNGTSALHLALLASGVQPGDLVITQPLTFVASCNAISYVRAQPVFVDIDKATLGLSDQAMSDWLSENAFMDDDGNCLEKKSRRRISTCIPMHTFGHPVRIDRIITLCLKWNIKLVEDSAESLGSFFKNRHTGTFGVLGCLSFNGNKIITTGGGGAVLCSGSEYEQIKHVSTTAKVPHPYKFRHDQVGYNYRMPNINAALGCIQLEKLQNFLLAKRTLAMRYKNFFLDKNVDFFSEPADCVSNYWLNAVVCESKKDRDNLVQSTNNRNIMTRPVWELMYKLKMYEDCLRGPMQNAEFFSDRLINLPSSVIPEFYPKN